MLALLLKLFGCIAPKHFKIIWLSNLSILSVSDEGYSKKHVVCIKSDMYVFITYSVLVF
jgi:hypothetical protein